jgi:Asp/Glu/hydantoin racemase
MLWTVKKFSILAFNQCMALSQKVTITTTVATSKPIMEGCTQHEY